MADGFINFPGSARVKRFLANAAAVQAWMPEVMEEMEDVIVEDNRRGVLAGVQCDDTPMPDVTYRNGKKKRTATRKGDRFGTKVGGYKGPKLTLGRTTIPATAANGNLTTAEYQKLTGPPLAPRGDESRVIANLFTKHYQAGDVWIAEGAWLNVVSAKGVPFLHFHFEGAGRLPKRNLAGLRSWGRAEARKRAVRKLRERMRRGA